VQLPPRTGQTLNVEMNGASARSMRRCGSGRWTGSPGLDAPDGKMQTSPVAVGHFSRVRHT
jgi:hypothetical protein